MHDEKTIYAPASAQGKAGVAVFRISGVDSGDVFATLCLPKDRPSPRQAVLRTIRHPESGEILDEALVLFFEAPHSFTGEDVVELHTHGGRAVTSAILEALGALPGFRLAEPGEFTRRAFENGKMDLTEAEAIADLVHAETEAQRKQAYRQMQGALGDLYRGWSDRLTQSLAMMEASLDFADEDLPEDLFDRQTALLDSLRDDIRAHLDDNHRGERLREGFSIVLLGAPNAGKSSLLNALARRDAAIVSSVAGTTRDVIDVALDIGGYPVLVSDTAGLRDDETDGGAPETRALENEGMRRARLRARDADLKIAVIDGTERRRAYAVPEGLVDRETLVVVNKADLLEGDQTYLPVPQGLGAPLYLSALTGQGINALLRVLGREIDKRFGATEQPPLTRARHRAALQECLDGLDRARNALQADLRAEDVRLAQRALGRITGRVDVEDLLDIIFRDFCIGK
ncbi:MAG: tRNA uridine-5-carboxymethylaminomethyl(34) synthesis GTPase MnmE [Alphaproteobacteria bacterium]|nr:tRNA uridine-5-carboxymethylaminomethyl(34) synthesis GTPase MnmE [Alphaproteobacteria bacterium]